MKMKESNGRETGPTAWGGSTLSCLGKALLFPDEYWKPKKLLWQRQKAVGWASALNHNPAFADQRQVLCVGTI